MPTYIDESGDTGHSHDSLPYFRLAAVWVPSLEEVGALRDEIRRFRKNSQINHSYEFKFARTHSQPDKRLSFFQAALKREFRFAVCSIDNTDSYWRTATSEEQHWAVATFLAVSLRSTYLEMETSIKLLMNRFSWMITAIENS